MRGYDPAREARAARREGEAEDSEAEEEEVCAQAGISACLLRAIPGLAHSK